MDPSRRCLAEGSRQLYHSTRARNALLRHETGSIARGTFRRHSATDARLSKPGATPLGGGAGSHNAVHPSAASSAPHPHPQPPSSSSPLSDRRSPSRPESTSLQLRGRMNELVAQAASGFETIGGKLNQVTGYSEIEDLKRQVRHKEDDNARLRTAARAAKRAFEDAVAQRSACQREVNDLLQRKSNWTESDVSRFTALVREDHLNEQAEQRAKLEAAKAEEDVERGQTELMQTILHRYHEEQVWSDKIRSASTYGSLLALGLNLFVFILAIVVVEPWKRRRLAQTFEKRVQAMEKENQELVEGGMQRLQKSLDAYEATISRIATAVMPPGSAPLPPMPPILVESLSEIDMVAGATAAERSPVTEPVDWKSALLGAWEKARTGSSHDTAVVLAGVSGAVIGALATGVVTFAVWSFRRQ